MEICYAHIHSAMITNPTKRGIVFKLTLDLSWIPLKFTKLKTNCVCVYVHTHNNSSDNFSYSLNWYIHKAIQPPNKEHWTQDIIVIVVAATADVCVYIYGIEKVLKNNKTER